MNLGIRRPIVFSSSSPAVFKQSVSTDLGTGVTSLAVTWTTQNCTSGSLLVAALLWSNDGNTISLSGVADTTNGAWTPVGSTLAGAGGLANYSSQMYYFANNTSVAKPTVTMTLAGGSSLLVAIAIHEYTGENTLEKSAYVNLNSATPSQSITPTNSSDLVFAYGVPSSAVTSVALPFTLREDANWATSGTADDCSPTGGTAATANWTITSSADNMMGIAVFS